MLFLGWRYPENPPPAHTGGFGEPTCHACHVENDLNLSEGALALHGIDAGYVERATHHVVVYLSGVEMEKAGMQLSVRYASGVSEGEQAGTLLPLDNRLAVDAVGGIQYIRHTKVGTLPNKKDFAAWRFKWIAPVAKTPVVFHVAANAANGDASEFGDKIFIKEATFDSRP